MTGRYSDVSEHKQTPPYHTVHLAINLKCQIRLAAELLYKSLVMPVIVILFHCCNFFCKITDISEAGQCVIAETDIFDKLLKDETMIRNGIFMREWFGKIDKNLIPLQSKNLLSFHRGLPNKLQIVTKYNNLLT